MAKIGTEEFDDELLIEHAGKLAEKHLHGRGVQILENNWGKYKHEPPGSIEPAFAKYIFTLGFINGAIQKMR